MISIAICDDELQFQKILKGMVARYMRQLGIAYYLKMFDSGNELVDYCAAEHELTVIFLDISMDEIDGIETAKRIRAMSEDVYIVFVTAYIKYSLEGYKVNAIRYLIKGDKNFEQSLEECIDAILEKIEFNTRTIEFEFREGRKEIPVDSIVYMGSSVHTVSFYMQGSRKHKKKYTMTALLNDVEKMLEGYNFLRIHQSYLVNLKHVKTMKSYQAIMDNGAVLPIPRAKFRTLKEKFIEYRGEL